MQADKKNNTSSNKTEERQKLSPRGACHVIPSSSRNHCFISQFQNTKNENASLKKSLEQLKTKRELIDAKEEKGESSKRENTGTERGEGEGKDTRKEEKVREDEEKRADDIIRVRREDGEGEEVFEQKERKGEERVMKGKTKDRGEAEGEKEIDGEKERQKETREEEGSKMEDEVPKPERKEEEKKEADHTPSIDTSQLTAQLQEAQEEADRQAAIAQDLRTKLGEQSKKAWEAEQRLVVLEAQTQRMKKSAEMLTDARKQIEVLCQLLVNENNRIHGLGLPCQPNEGLTRGL